MAALYGMSFAQGVALAHDEQTRVLGGKGSKAKTGRLWVYVRDDRPHRGSNGDATAPPAARAWVWPSFAASRGCMAVTLCCTTARCVGWPRY